MEKLTEQYARHAERFGFEGVWECARGDLPPIELGHLSLQLQRIDRCAAERLDDRARRRRPAWKLPQDEARGLAEALEAEGLPDRQIAAMATVTTKTLRSWRANPEAGMRASPAGTASSRRSWHAPSKPWAASTTARPSGGLTGSSCSTRSRSRPPVVNLTGG
jgi:hypothetical protein